MWIHLEELQESNKKLGHLYTHFANLYIYVWNSYENLPVGTYWIILTIFCNLDLEVIYKLLCFPFC